MNEYLLEKKLKEQSPALHRQMRDNVAVLNKMLESFLSWFPDFTDHSALHSMDVLEYCNLILGQQVEFLSAEECYVLIMACYLHDVGLTINRKDYEIFLKELGLESYRKDHPEMENADIIREFHHEFSGVFIRKYAGLFDFASEEQLFAIIQISRGHRRVDLFDEKEYYDIKTKDGVIRTAFLSAVIRLADEIDIGANRNPELLFDTSRLTKQKDIDSFAVHKSIRTVDVLRDKIVIGAKSIEDRITPMIESTAEKVQKTLDYCRKVAEKRSDLRIFQKNIVIENLDGIRIPLKGRIDSDNAAELAGQIDEILERTGEKNPVFDAQELSYVSSAGLRVLMGVRKKTGKNLVIENVSRDVYEIFEMTGFTELFDVRKKMREISVDGCEVIGKGYYGTVYRLDADTVVKVYNSRDALAMIENEQRLSKAAFLKGIPTAIPYDIVKVGDLYGSVFELLDSTTCTKWLCDSPDELKNVVESYTALLKLMHSTKMDKGCCPSARKRFIGYVETVKHTLPEDKYERLKMLVEAVPESLNAIHGDCHMNNIIRTGGELMIIDMDTMAAGNAVFDLAGVFFNYKCFEEDEPGNTERVLGISAETADYIWNEVIRLYFEDRDEKTLESLRNRIMLVGWLQFLYRMETDFKGRPLSDVRSAHAAEHIAELLEITETLEV